MNALMMRKKKYRFQVELRVEWLQHVPLVDERLYAKVRLLDGGFTSQSTSLLVQDHAVHWDETFRFSCKMTANASTGELDTCTCRVSVRQEVRGGKSFQKLGYADVNLAQFAGPRGWQSYILKAYDTKHRLHNSTLKVTVDMTLLSGDPCFKAQSWPHSTPPLSVERPQEDKEGGRQGGFGGSVGSLPSLGYNSLDKKAKGEEDARVVVIGEEAAGHSRNSSNTSGSGYVSNASHSDKSGHTRSGSLGSGGGLSEGGGGSLERPLSGRGVGTAHKDLHKESRVVSTRGDDAATVINQIFQDTIGDVTAQGEGHGESPGLQLLDFIGRGSESGSTTANAEGGEHHHIHHPLPPTSEFKPIVFGKR